MIYCSAEKHDAPPTGRQRLFNCLLILCLSCGGILAGCGENQTDAEYLAQAKGAYDQGDFQTAIIELKNSLQKNPENPEARLMLGQIYLKTGNFVSAEKELGRAIELGAPSTAVLADLAEAVLLQGKVDGLLTLTEGARDLSPGDMARVHTLRGGAYIATRDYNLASIEFEAALLADEEYSDAMLGMATLANIDNSGEAARSLVDEALEADQNSAKAWRFLADLERAEGNAQAAERAYTKAIENRPYNTEDRLVRALTRIYLKDYEGAREDIQNVKQRNPKIPGLYYAEGVLALQEQRYEDAQNLFEETLRLEPDYLLAKYYLGALQAMQGNIEQARSNLSQYLVKAPGSVAARLLLADIYLQKGQYDDADRVAAPLLGLDPPDPVALNLLAKIRLAQGKTQESLGLTKMVVEVAPESDRAYTQLALQQLQFGDPQEGLAILESAAENETASIQDDIQLVRALLQEGDLERALDVANKLRAEQPNNSVAYSLLGKIYLEKRDMTAAKDAFSKAVELNPGDPVAALQLADMALAAGEIEQARDYCQSVLRARPEYLPAMLKLAVIETRRGRIDEARSILVKAMETHPRAIEPRVYLANYHLRSGQPLQALDIAKEGREYHPLHPSLLLITGKAQLAMGQPENAAQTFEQQLTVQPESAEGYYWLALADLERQKLKSAGENLQRALALEPNHLPSQISHARLLMLTGESDNARRQLERLRQQQPENAEVLGLQGWMALREGRYEDAVTALKQAQQYAVSSRLVRDLAQAQWNTRDWGEMIVTLEDWLQKHPEDTAVRYDLANYQMMMQRRNEAQDGFETVLETSPGHVGALNNLAWLLRQSDPDKALTLARKAYELAPENPAVLDTNGVLLLSDEKPARALQFFEISLEQRPADPSVRYHLAQAQVQLGQTQEAKLTLRKLLAENKSFPEIGEARVLLDQLESE